MVYGIVIKVTTAWLGQCWARYMSADIPLRKKTPALSLPHVFCRETVRYLSPVIGKFGQDGCERDHVT